VGAGCACVVPYLRAHHWYRYRESTGTGILYAISVSVHINRYTSPGSLKTGEDDDDALTCAPKLRIGKILSFRIKLKRNKINSSRD